MSTHRFTFVGTIDDDALRAHDGADKPPPNDLADWYGGDIDRATELGILEIEHEPLEVDAAEERLLERARAVRRKFYAQEGFDVDALLADAVGICEAIAERYDHKLPA